MARTQALSLLRAAATKADLKEIYGIVIDNVQKDTLSSALKSQAYTGNPAAGSAEFKRFVNSAAKDYLKKSIDQAKVSGSSFATTASAWVAGISILITVIAALVSKYKEAQAEALKAAQERAKAYTLVDEEIAATERYLTVVQNETAAVKDIQKAREELIELFPSLVQGYDAEGKAILGNIELLKQEYEWKKKIADLETEQTASDFETLTTELKKAVTAYQAAKHAFEQPNDTPDEEAWRAGLYKGKTQLAEGQQAIYESLIQLRNSFLANLQTLFGTDAVAAMDGVVANIFDSLTEAIESGADADEISDLLHEKLNLLYLADQLIPDAYAMGSEISRAILQGIFDGDMAPEEAQAFIARYLNINGMVGPMAAEQMEGLKARLIAILAGDEGTSETDAAGIVNWLLGGLNDDAALTAAMARAQELKEKILSGTASQGEMDEYNELAQTIQSKLLPILEKAASATDTGIEGAEELQDAVGDLGAEYKLTAEQIAKAAGIIIDANKGYKEAKGLISDVSGSVEDLKRQFEEIASMKGALQAIKTGAEDAAAARQYLADMYGVEESAIDSMIPAIDQEIQYKEALVMADYAIAMQSAITAATTIANMILMDESFRIMGTNMLLEIDRIIVGLSRLQDAFGGGGTIPPSGGYRPVARSSGGGSSKNTALQKELDLLEHKKSLDQVTAQEEIAWLERAYKKYAKTTADKQDLTEKLYALRKSLAESDLEYRKSLDQLTMEEEIAATEKMLYQYKLGTDARREVEVKLYDLKKEYLQRAYDDAVYYGKLTIRQQEQQLKSMIALYKEGTDARIDLEKQLYEVQQSIREADIDRLDTITDALMEALKNRYEAQRKLEEAQLKASIEDWQAWGDAQTKAIQDQIDALDALSEEEDAAEEERKKRRAIAALEQQLQYEQDAYNRKKLQEQLATAQADLDKWLLAQEREALKKSLQAQIEEIEKVVDANEARLNEQLDGSNAYYEELTKAASLQAEAQRILMQSSQEDIIGLLQSFAEDYNLTGQSLGEQLVDGFLSQVSDIETWFTSLAERMSSYQANLAAAANAAADQFYMSRGMTPTGGTTSGAASTGGAPTIIMHFHDKVEDPTAIRREIERLTIELANL